MRLGMMLVFAAAITGPAQAAIYHFDFMGPSPSSWLQFDLDSMPTPDGVADDFSFRVDHVLTMRNDSVGGPESDYVSYTFFPKRVQVSDGSFEQAGGFTMNSAYPRFYGPQLFTGSLFAPKFKLGTFLFNSDTSSLTISNAAPAAPEASTWAMMLIGFGMAGLPMRRRLRVGCS